MYISGHMQLIQPAVSDSVYFKYKSLERKKRNLSTHEQILREQRAKSLSGKIRVLNDAKKSG